MIAFIALCQLEWIGSNSTTSKERTYPLYSFLLCPPVIRSYTTSEYISIYKTISIDSAIPRGCVYVCVCVHIRVLYVLFLSILRQEIRDHERGRSDRSADKFIPVESRTIDPRLIIARTSCYDIRMKCVCKANSNKWYFHKWWYRWFFCKRMLN